jgi:hypothetical protein
MSQQKPLPYVVKDLQPEYITVEDDVSGPHGFSDDPKFALRADFIEKVKGVPAVRGWWRCPYCKMEFDRRKPCEKHMGLVPNLPAFCRVLINEDEVRRSRGRIITVELTEQEYEEAIAIGLKRMKCGIELNRKQESGIPAQEREMDDLLGALGERAYAKWRGLPVESIAFYPADLRAHTRGEKPSDFGPVDVKAKQKGGTYMLVLENANIKHIFVLASAKVGDYFVNLCGWEQGKVVMNRQKYWGQRRNTGRPPAYWFPETLLRPMSTLNKFLESVTD